MFIWNAVTFDLDNTLFSHEKAFENAIKECFYTYMASCDSSDCKTGFDEFFPLFKYHSDEFWDKYEKGTVSGTEYRRMRFNETMKKLSLPYGEESADKFHDHYYSIVAEYSEPYYGVKEMLQYLYESGVKTGIITNGAVDTQYEKIKKLGISRWINKKFIIVSEEAGVSKPEAGIFRMAESRLEENGLDIVHIGDSWEQDVTGAIDAGWKGVFLNTRGESRSSDHKPVAEYSTFASLKNSLIGKVGERRSV